jgi:transcriptional regulator of met regulon
MPLAVAIAIAAIAALAACDRPKGGAGSTRGEPPAVSATARCPTGKPDPARTQRVRSLLAEAPAGRRLLERAPAPLHLCFAQVAVPTITAERAVTLDEREDDAENAARLAHLLLHAIEGAPLPDDIDRSRPCSALVRDAIKAEAKAHALELQLRRELGVTRPRRAYAFERDYWHAPAERRIEVVESYLWSHPRGGAGLPGFVDELTQRCAALKRSRVETPGRAPAER